MNDRELRYLLNKKIYSNYLETKIEDPFITKQYESKKPSLPEMYIVKEKKK